MIRKLRSMVAALAVTALAGAAHGALVIDDHFDDGDVATNSLGVGTGFSSAFTGAGSAFVESGNLQTLLAMVPVAANITGISSKETFDFFNPNGATVVWTVDHYLAPQPAASNSFRAFVGVGDSVNNIAGTWGSPHVTNDANVWVQLKTNDNALAAGLEGALIVDKGDSSPADVLASWSWSTFNGIFPLRITMDLDQSGYDIGFSDGSANVTGAWGGYFTPADWSAGARAIASAQSNDNGRLVLERIEVTAIPEPSALGLACVGGLAFGGRRLGRRT